jgi:hypothetical protein
MAWYNSIPWVGRWESLQSADLISQRSPEEQAKLQSEYRDAIQIGKEATFSVDAFEKFDQARPKDFKVFKDTKGPGDISIHDLLEEESPEAIAVKDAIKTALTLKPPTPPATDGPYIKAKKIYETSVANFREQANKIPTYMENGVLKRRTASSLIEVMKELQDDAIKAIKEQQKIEIDQLKTTFAASAPTSTFNTSLGTALGLTTSADIEAAKASMIKDLESSHTKQLADFEKSTSESMKGLLKTSTTEIAYIARLHKYGSDEVRIMISEIKAKAEKTAEQERQRINVQRQAEGLAPLPKPDPAPTTVGVNIDAHGTEITGVTIADLPMFKTLTGKEIKPVEGKPGTFSIEMNSTLWDWRYHNNKQYIKADLMDLAMAIKACGHEGIVFKLTFDDPEIAMERGRQAYEAAIESGFPPNKIKIIVNGREMKPGKPGESGEIASVLFKDCQHRLGNANAQSAAILKRLSDSKPALYDRAEVAAIKAEMARGRANVAPVFQTTTVPTTPTTPPASSEVEPSSISSGSSPSSS